MMYKITSEKKMSARQKRAAKEAAQKPNVNCDRIVLRQQELWNKRHRLYDLYMSGNFTLQSLGDSLGLTRERIRQLIYMAKRDRQEGRRSPMQCDLDPKYINYQKVLASLDKITLFVEVDQ